MIVEAIREETAILVKHHGFADSLVSHRYNSNGESETIRYVLERVEAAIRSQTRGLPAHDVNEYRASWARTRGSSAGAVRDDLDHVWPQSDRANFPSAGDGHDSDSHHRIGNLVLWFANGHRPSGDTPARDKLSQYYGQNAENIVRYLLSPSSADQTGYSWARGLGLIPTTEWTTESVRRLGMFYVLAISEVLGLPLEAHVQEYRDSLA